MNRKQKKERERFLRGVGARAEASRVKKEEEKRRLREAQIAFEVWRDLMLEQDAWCIEFWRKIADTPEHADAGSW